MVFEASFESCDIASSCSIIALVVVSCLHFAFVKESCIAATACFFASDRKGAKYLPTLGCLLTSLASRVAIQQPCIASKVATSVAYRLHCLHCYIKQYGGLMHVPFRKGESAHKVVDILSDSSRSLGATRLGALSSA